MESKMNLTNVNGNLMNPESTVGRSTQLKVLFLYYC